MRIRRVGNYWIKEVNPEASRLAQWYGRGSIKAQAEGLEKLGDMGTDFLYREGKIVTRHAGEFEGGYLSPEFWQTWREGSRRLGTVFNDIRVRNVGQGGVVFDPSLHPVAQGVYRVGAGTVVVVGGTAIWYAAQDDE